MCLQVSVCPQWGVYPTMHWTGGDCPEVSAERVSGQGVYTTPPPGPEADTPLRPEADIPLGLEADTPHPGYYRIRSTSGRYASYWKAFLLIFNFNLGYLSKFRTKEEILEFHDLTSHCNES